MKVSMVVASSEAMACRVFIGCEDVASKFAAWLQMNGWQVRMERCVDPRTQPRIFEEEAVAATLTAEFDRWLGSNA